MDEALKTDFAPDISRSAGKYLGGVENQAKNLGDKFVK